MARGRDLAGIFDWLAFVSLIPAGVAAGLIVAAAAALGAPRGGALAVLGALAASGTLVVYNVDRLRDTGMDGASAPLRTAFVEAQRRALWGVTALATVVSLALALATSLDVALLCAAVLLVGLLHRRLKPWRAAKPVYVASAWVAVTAGIPALSASESELIPWLLAIYSTSIAANLLASNLREATPVASLLAAARALAAIGVLIALVGPEATRPLAAIPAAELAALACFRNTERYAHIALDGALLIGALTALALKVY